MITAAPPVIRMCTCGHPERRHDHDGCRFGCDCTGFTAAAEFTSDPAQPVRRGETLIYTAPQVMRVCGITYRQLDYWARTGYITDRADGSGSRREFTGTEVDTIHAAAGLIRLGFIVPRAFEIARELATNDAYRAEFADIWQLSITCRPAEGTQLEGEHRP